MWILISITIKIILNCKDNKQKKIILYKKNQNYFKSMNKIKIVKP